MLNGHSILLHDLLDYVVVILVQLIDNFIRRSLGGLTIALANGVICALRC